MHLYKYNSSDVNNIADYCDDFDLKIFIPSLRGLFLKGEKTGLKTALIRLYFQSITFGKAKIYYVQKGENLVHTSYVIPACFKFPFMGKHDLEIGPCYTYSAFRGQGIYPKVLKEICKIQCKDTSSFYMIVDETNTSSIKGIEKAGFTRCGSVYKSKFMKRYRSVR